MTPQQLHHLALSCRGWLNRIRWRLCWLLMPSLTFAREKRRLEDIARSNGASRSMAHGIASAYFNALRDNR